MVTPTLKHKVTVNIFLSGMVLNFQLFNIQKVNCISEFKIANAMLYSLSLTRIIGPIGLTRETSNACYSDLSLSAKLILKKVYHDNDFSSGIHVLSLNS